MAGTIIITGAAGGLGQAVAQNIINRPEHFSTILTVRNHTAPNAKPLLDLVETARENAEVQELDLGNFDAVRTFARSINKRIASKQLPPIRALILNAAVIPVSNQRFYVTSSGGEDKLEMMFAVNHLANFLLTLLLLESIDRGHGRILLVSSHAHDPNTAAMQKYHPEKIGWNLTEISRAQSPPEPGDEANDTMRRYGMSKLCQIIFMHALQKRLNSRPELEHICVLAVNPGAMVHANIFNKMNPFVKFVVGPIAQKVFKVIHYLNPSGIVRTVEKSAADVERAALAVVDPELGEFPKDTYLDGDNKMDAAADSFDEHKEKELWDLSLELTQLEESQTVLG